MQESLDVIGHVQCSHGLTIGALLAACLDAVCRFEEKDPLDILNDLKSSLPSLLGAEHEITRSISVSRENPGSILVLSGSIGDDPEISLAEIRERLSATQDGGAVGLEWTTKTCLEMIDVLIHCKSKVLETLPENFSIKNSKLLHALLCLHCLKRLGVQQLCCTSPIPFDPLMEVSSGDEMSLAVSRDLLVGFAVNCVSSAEPVADPTAIALLRVLGGNQLNGSQPLPIILKTSGIGRSSLSGRAVVSLLVGQLDPSSAATLVTTYGGSQSPSISTPLWLSDKVTQLECNLDDITGEILAYTVTLLLEYGAYDAWVTPMVMKKGRPAHTLHCLCTPRQEDDLLQVLFRHTTTLGVRIYRDVPRAKLCRSIEVAQTPYTETARHGKVNVKVSSFCTGEVVSIKPEFDHCEEISREMGVPIKWVTEAALANVRAQRGANEESKQSMGVL